MSRTELLGLLGRMRSNTATTLQPGNTTLQGFTVPATTDDDVDWIDRVSPTANTNLTLSGTSFSVDVNTTWSTPDLVAGNYSVRETTSSTVPTSDGSDVTGSQSEPRTEVSLH